MQHPDPVVTLACELIGIDSVNPGLMPDAAGERAAATHLAARLERSGFAVDLLEDAHDPRRCSVIAVHDSGRAGPTVLLNGHLDTVGVEGMDAPFTPRIEGDRLRGRGASDMKGGVGGLVIAAEAIARTDAPGRIIVALVADEEDASIGAQTVIAHLGSQGIAADVCLIAEPTWLAVTAAHRGFALYTVTLGGRAAHSSQPELGVDVMPALGTLLADILRHDGALRSIALHPLLPHGSLMATVVRAGSAPFTVAARAEISVERRTVPGEPADIGRTELEGLLDRLTAAHHGVEASIDLVVARSPWALDADGPAADLAVLLESSLEETAARTGAPYWMESALWQEAGVPTLVCGPAGGGLHAVDEWIDLAQLRAFPTAVAHAVDLFLRGETPVTEASAPATLPA